MGTSSRSGGCLITLAGLILLINRHLDCSPVEDDIFRESRRFKDVPRAINYMHELLPHNLPLEEKCKRYAVLLAMAAATGLPYEPNVLELIALDNDDINIHYQAIDIKRLSLLYMNAAEKYRITRLAPPFIEIIECLQKIDTSVAKKYLGDKEVKTIVNVYRRVINPQDATATLEDLDMSKFHPTFLTNLRNLFEGFLDFDHLCETSQVRLVEHQVGPDSLLTSKAGSSSLQEGDVPNSGKNNKEKYLIRRRERARLAQRRQRMLDPEKMRQRNRIHKRRYRERKRQQDSRPKPDALTPEEKRTLRLQRRRAQRQVKRLEKLEQHKRHTFRMFLDHLQLAQPGTQLFPQLQQTLGTMPHQLRPQVPLQQHEQSSIDPPDRLLPLITTALPTEEQVHLRPAPPRALVNPMTSFPGFVQPAYASYHTPSPLSPIPLSDMVPRDILESISFSPLGPDFDLEDFYQINPTNDDNREAKGDEPHHVHTPRIPNSFGTGEEIQTLHDPIESVSQLDDTDTIMRLLSSPPPTEASSLNLHQPTSRTDFSEHDSFGKETDKQ